MLVLIDRMNARAGHYGDISRKIWEFAEVGYKEKQSSDLLKAELQSNGFHVQESVAEIPTAAMRRAVTRRWHKDRKP